MVHYVFVTIVISPIYQCG